MSGQVQNRLLCLRFLSINALFFASSFGPAPLGQYLQVSFFVKEPQHKHKWPLLGLQGLASRW